MAKYIVLMTRTCTVTETATVIVGSTAEVYAKKDALAAANRVGWTPLTSETGDPEYHSVVKTSDQAKET